MLQQEEPTVTIFMLILANVCLAIAAGCWCAEDIDEGAQAFGAVLFVGIGVLLAWLALR
jgi:hypothetical protein